MRVTLASVLLAVVLGVPGAAFAQDPPPTPPPPTTTAPAPPAGYGGYGGYGGYYGPSGCDSEDGYYYWYGRCDNRRPSPSISASPAAPLAGATVTLTAIGAKSGSTVAWDTDDDGAFDDTATATFAAGTHRVRVRETDVDGRVGIAMRTVNVHARNIGPSVSLSTTQTPRVGQTFALFASASDIDGTVAALDVDTDGDGTYETSMLNQYSRSISFATAGSRTLRARATDDRGERSYDTVEVHVHAGNRAPVANPGVSNSQPRPGQAISIYGSGSDSDGTIVSTAFDLDGNGTYETPQPSNQTLTTSFATSGRKTIGVRVVDDQGAAGTAEITLIVVDNNIAPTISFSSPVAGSRTVQAYVSDPDGVQQIAWDLDDDGVFDDFVGGYTATSAVLPGDGPGSFPVAIRATDNLGAVRTTRRVIQVRDAVNRLPLIYAPFQPRAGTAVTISAGDTTSAATYDWDFDGDGAFDDAIGTTYATFTYAEAGTYDVRLRQTLGTSVQIVRTLLVVSPATGPLSPALSISATPRAPRTGASVSLSAYLSTSASGTTYTWDLDGDGGFDDATGSSVSFTPSVAGLRDIAVQAAADSGTVLQRTTLDVHATNQPPAPYVSTTPSGTNGEVEITTGESVSFYGSVSESDDAISSTAWDLDGDGAYDDASGSSASKLFTTSGVTRVRVRVTDEGGASGYDAVDVRVSPPVGNRPPVASSLSGYSVRVGTSTTIYGYATDPDRDTLTYAWDTDDDGVFDDATGQSLTTTFTTVGTTRLRLRVTDPSGASDIVSGTVRVIANSDIDPPQISLYIPSFVTVGAPVQFSAYTSGFGSGLYLPTTLTFDLDGDGAFDDLPTQALGQYRWTFPTAGSVTIAVRATDTDGRVGTDTRTIQVRDENLGPNVSLTTVSSVTAGQATQFYASGSDPDGGSSGLSSYGPCKLDWDLDGDGAYDDATTSPQFYCSDQRSVTPPTAGAQASVGVRMTDAGGATSEARTTFTASSDAPSAAFAAPTVVGPGQAVTLTSEATDTDGTIVARAWDLDDDGQFDDGAGTTANTSFERAGVFLVGHKVRDNTGDVGIVYHPIQVVRDDLPRASFSVSTAPRVNRPVTFTSTSSDPDGAADITSQAWDLDGDGAYDDATGATATRTFTTPGPKTIGLRITDAAGHQDTSVRTVTIAPNQPPVAGFTRTPTAPTAGDSVAFTSTASDPDGTITATAWDLDNDGAFDDATGLMASRLFTTGGTKTVRQRVTDDDGETAVVTSTFTVTGGGAPVASFTVSPAEPQVGQAATLTSTSTDPDGVITTTAWDFDGDGEFDDGLGTPTAATFSTAGSREVAVRVTDDAGNIAQATRVVRVRAANRVPSVTLRANKERLRVNEAVTVRATATDPDGDTVTSYAFDLDGDGTFAAPSASATASTTFTSAGARTMRVKATDPDGATAVASLTVTVSAENQPPVASVSVNRTAGRRLDATGASFTFTGVAWDVDDTAVDPATGAPTDDGLSLWQWDLNGDGDFTDSVDRSGADLRTVTAKLGAGATGTATHTVTLRVTDSYPGTPGQSSRSVTVTTFEGNRPPVVSIRHSPFAAQRNVPITLTGTVTDPDDDAIAALAWDTDADGSFDDGTSASVQATFASTGTKTVRLRATDAQGAQTVGTYEVVVSGAHPKASIATVPFSPVPGEAATLRVTATDADGTIASIAWDTDGDGEFDDGTGPELTRTFPETAVVHLAARVRDNDGNEVIARQAVTVRPPFIIDGGTASGVQTPTPTISDRNGAPAPVVTSVDPETGRLTIRGIRGVVAGLPGACAELKVEVPIKGDASAVTLILRRPSGQDVELSMSPKRNAAGDTTGTWIGQVDCLETGQLLVRYRLPAAGGGFDVIGPIPIGGIELIDPQGVVYDQEAFTAALAAKSVTEATATDEQKTAARAVAAITGATVTLQRQATDGTWANVNALDPGISPNVNPQVTGGDGLYKWDVSAGVYRVRVSAPGYDGVTSTSALIPPPKLDLHITLARNYAPKAGFSVIGSLVAGSSGTYRSTASVTNGQIAKVEWDFDNDGQFDDRAGDEVTWNYATSGARTVRIRATDTDGEVATATQIVTVAAQPTPPLPPGPTTPTPTDTPPPAAGAASPAAQSPPADTSGPKVTLKLPTGAALTRAKLRTGLPVTVTCSEACGATITSAVDKATAKKLKRKTTALGRATSSLAANKATKVTLKLDAKALKTARRLKRLKVTVQVTALDVAGNATTVRRTVTLRP